MPTDSDTQDTYSPESAGGLMLRKVPLFTENDKSGDVITEIAKEKFDDVHYIYVLDDERKLVGITTLSKIVLAKEEKKLADLMDKPRVTVYPETDQEKVVIEALRNDIKSVSVVDKEGHFLGAVVADQIIDVLHEEHLEDFLRSSGIRGKGSKILDFIDSNFFEIIKARIPWLCVGLLIGLAASFVVSRFEYILHQYTALAFFISMVAYMSDSVGTQSETIFIRSQAILKFNIFTYVLRELLIGMTIGGILGVIAGIIAALIIGSVEIGFILSISLFISMSIATVLACLTPIVLKWFGKDPAVGSGPFTTAIQDMVSLLIYFSVAMMVLSYFKNIS